MRLVTLIVVTLSVLLVTAAVVKSIDNVDGIKIHNVSSIEEIMKLIESDDFYNDDDNEDDDLGFDLPETDDLGVKGDHCDAKDKQCSASA